MSEKRPRGRPPGEGKKDGTHLAKIADIMIARKMKKATTAMRAYIAQSGIAWKETDSTLIRRWQVKWKLNSESILEAARERAKPIRRTGGDVPYAQTGRNNLERVITGYASPYDIPLHVQDLLGIARGLHGTSYESPMEAMMREERKLRDSIFETISRTTAVDLLASTWQVRDPFLRNRTHDPVTKAALGISDSILNSVLDPQFNMSGTRKFLK